MIKSRQAKFSSGNCLQRSVPVPAVACCARTSRRNVAYARVSKSALDRLCEPWNRLASLWSFIRSRLDFVGGVVIRALLSVTKILPYTLEYFERSAPICILGLASGAQYRKLWSRQ